MTAKRTPEQARAQAINAIALRMRATMEALDKMVGEWTDGAPRNIILVIGAGDEVQYGANVPRETGIQILRDLFGRWRVGLPDLMPGEQAGGDTRAFEYLLDCFERSVGTRDPRCTDYQDARTELLRYVGRLEARARRG